MSNKIFCLALCTLLLAFSFPAEAQQQAGMHKIGWLGARPAAIATGLKLLGQELRKLGYVEGENITFESRYADGKYDRLAALAGELVSMVRLCSPQICDSKIERRRHVNDRIGVEQEHEKEL